MLGAFSTRRLPAAVLSILQKKLARKVKITPLKKTPRLIAGVDCSYRDNRAVAAVSVFTFPDLKHIEDALASRRIPFPYIPGYLSFREGPSVLSALGKLKRAPDILLFDGQGIAHPRGLGIASHIGVLTGLPSIGCAKTRLVGSYRPPGEKKGDWSRLCYRGKTVGAVLRTRDGVKPLFVSPGHKIDLKDAISIVLKSLGGYRIPEPLRRADHLGRRQ